MLNRAFKALLVAAAIITAAPGVAQEKIYPAAVVCDYIGAAMIGITVVLQKLRDGRIERAAK